MTGKDIARLKRALKRGPKMTRRERAEYLRWLMEEEDEPNADNRTTANPADRSGS